MVAGGAGRQAAAAVVASGYEAVVVGEQMVADPAGAIGVSPLVLVSDGIESRTIAVDAPGVSLVAACPGPGGTVLAVGHEDTSGRSLLVMVDAARDAVTIPARGPDGVTVTSCAGDGDVVLLAADRALLTSSDGATVVPLGGLAPGEVVTGVAAGPGGFAVTGTRPGSDGFLLVGSSPDALVRVEVPALGGAGVQEPTGVVVHDDGVVVLGLGGRRAHGMAGAARVTPPRHRPGDPSGMARAASVSGMRSRSLPWEHLDLRRGHRRAGHERRRHLRRRHAGPLAGSLHPHGVAGRPTGDGRRARHHDARRRQRGVHLAVPVGVLGADQELLAAGVGRGAGCRRT